MAKDPLDSAQRKNDDFRFTVRTGEGTARTSDSLARLLDGWREGNEHWLFIAPHDDDIVMGAGLLIQGAVIEGVDVSVLVTTDGSMGYCDVADRERISEVRRAETRESLEEIGVRDVSWLGFPDGNLTPYLGRRTAREGDPSIVEGYTGLQNAYTYELRRRRPTRLFLASGNDLHPDHKAVYQEARISLFHAGGAIWPELGEPLEELPALYELAIYCAFSADPEYRIETTPQRLERKLRAIAAYRSQKQIGRLLERIRAAGPVEYLKRADLGLYSPEVYRNLFGPNDRV